MDLLLQISKYINIRIVNLKIFQNISKIYLLKLFKVIILFKSSNNIIIKNVLLYCICGVCYFFSKEI